MTTSDYLRSIVASQKKGVARGIYSVCSYNRYVIEAAFLQALEDDSRVLIESTCNQVNQFGGYTGMRPEDFKTYVFSIAEDVRFPVEKIILGGDHLGPYPFQREPARDAMDKAREMVRGYILSGCTKIHLDTSMPLAGDRLDRSRALPLDAIAERCAQLCAVAEGLFEHSGLKSSGLPAPLYVIGTEVPAPGGSDEVEEGLRVTLVEDMEETLAAVGKQFRDNDLQDAWERVFAIVVQPGVEHGDHTIVEYDREKAKELSRAIQRHPNIVYEGHATDYQTAERLREMVEDGIAILKVGPVLTFTLRETVFMLNCMEEELFGGRSGVSLSGFRETLDRAMRDNPAHWEKHYTGDETTVGFKRKYSFFDRARYYWADERVGASLALLLKNLKTTEIPLSLVSQFLPRQYEKIRDGRLERDPEAFIRDRIMEKLTSYSYAAGNRTEG